MNTNTNRHTANSTLNPRFMEEDMKTEDKAINLILIGLAGIKKDLRREK